MNNFEVLVVDDLESSAKTYAELIQKSTLLKTTFSTTFENTINCIKENPIKVVVLDQKMPEKSGTEIYKEIQKIAPDIIAIMFSGEADAKEVGEACTSLKYGTYLHKSDVKILPQKVLEMYAKYEVAVLDKNKITTISQSFLSKIISYILFRKKYSIVSFSVLSKQYIYDDLWKEIETINEGQIKEIKTEFSYQSKISINNEFSWLLKYNLSSLLNNLNGIIEQKHSSQYENSKSFTKTISLKTSFSNQIEALNLSKNQVVSKSYEMANVFSEYRILILEKCPLCKTKKIIPVIGYKQNNKYATRIIYYSMGNKKQIVDTGIHKI